MSIFALEFMRNALIAALLVGLMAPTVGVFVVQRRMALIGDGMGHVALAGVAIGVVTGQSPVFTALIVAVIAAVSVELIRLLGRTSADMALAVLFYGGIAAGVAILARGGGSSIPITSYLFGAISTASAGDLTAFAILTLAVIAVTWWLRDRLFAVGLDPEWATASRLPVLATNIALSALVATTVVMSMRVVGLLLISAVMVLPNAAGQVLARSFASSIRWALAAGVLASVGGVVLSYYADTPSGATIVLVSIAIFVLVAIASRVLRLGRTRERATVHPHVHWDGCEHDSVLHGDHVDYLHDGHRHAPHRDHWHEHGHVDDAQHSHTDGHDGPAGSAPEEVASR